MVLVCNNILNIFVLFSEDVINIFPSDAVCGLYTILTRGDIGGGSSGRNSKGLLCSIFGVVV